MCKQTTSPSSSDTSSAASADTSASTSPDVGTKTVDIDSTFQHAELGILNPGGKAVDVTSQPRVLNDGGKDVASSSATPCELTHMLYTPEHETFAREEVKHRVGLLRALIVLQNMGAHGRFGLQVDDACRLSFIPHDDPIYARRVVVAAEAHENVCLERTWDDVLEDSCRPRHLASKACGRTACTDADVLADARRRGVLGTVFASYGGGFPTAVDLNAETHTDAEGRTVPFAFEYACDVPEIMRVLADDERERGHEDAEHGENEGERAREPPHSRLVACPEKPLLVKRRVVPSLTWEEAVAVPDHLTSRLKIDFPSFARILDSRMRRVTQVMRAKGLPRVCFAAPIGHCARHYNVIIVDAESTSVYDGRNRIFSVGEDTTRTANGVHSGEKSTSTVQQDKPLHHEAWLAMPEPVREYSLSRSHSHAQSATFRTGRFRAGAIDALLARQDAGAGTGPATTGTGTSVAEVVRDAAMAHVERLVAMRRSARGNELWRSLHPDSWATALATVEKAVKDGSSGSNGSSGSSGASSGTRRGADAGGINQRRSPHGYRW